jgi:Holliday junction resolvase RusA-like endonuclease
VKIVIPLIPPSVNHYKMRTRKGVTFVSREAKSFKEAVAVIAGGQRSDGKFFRVHIAVFLGKGGKGDVDNFAKCCLDGLADARVIHSDAAITSLTIEKSRDIENPRTEITVTAL